MKAGLGSTQLKGLCAIPLREGERRMGDKQKAGRDLTGKGDSGLETEHTISKLDKI